MITKEIIEYNKKHELYHETQRPGEQEYVYASYYAHTHNMTDTVYLNTFSCLCSGIVGGMFMSVGSEYYFKEVLEYDAVDIVGLDFENNEDKIKAIHKLFEWFSENAAKYEKSVFQHGVRLPKQYHDKLLKQKYIQEDTMVGKIRYLMANNPSSNQKVVNNPDKKNLSWKFTYSDEKLWNEIQGETDLEKLVSIIG